MDFLRHMGFKIISLFLSLHNLRNDLWKVMFVYSFLCKIYEIFSIGIEQELRKIFTYYVMKTLLKLWLWRKIWKPIKIEKKVGDFSLTKFEIFSEDNLSL